ncbi:efflux transporter, outer membrane factor (OMF) lipoprotein, NodT family [Formivibrio citricus]|uniref:Efflux transporter, outer membrane factor (OMF) lipoprotein, NodT family n=1 Tax=Formivibrio citricus TaxID=83765 RepID=A0A1I4UY63_9NEIS|nr:efflux transporter outer membrane subunit [Formivibrio citricus]SFM93939.1 efflux transporter, outer membrane factor (OMF) lipoprotein, NodT family [Formivibrio citricus]
MNLRTDIALPGRLQVVALVLALTGCAQYPSLGQLPLMKDINSYKAEKSFNAASVQWPVERWWQVYGDKQLDSLIDEALQGSPNLAAASARLRRAEAVGQITGAALLPQLSANGSATEQKQSYNHLTPRAMLPDGWTDYGRATLDFSWEIDFWGKNRAALAAATSELEASRAEMAQARLALTAAVATNYTELARLFAARDTAARSVEVRSKTAALFAERFANGLETRGSLREAEARRAGAEGELLLVDEQIGLQRNRLAALLGAGPDRGLTIERPTMNLQRQIGLPKELAVNLLGRRPDVVAARLRAEAQLKRIDQKKAEFYPNVNLAGFIGWQSLGLDMLTKSGSFAGSIGPAISLPIFTGGRLRGELRGTAAAYDEAVANYNGTVTQALQDVADTALSQKALAGRLAKGEEAVAAATEAHRVARNRYEGGLSSYLEVLSAEDVLLNSLRSLTDLQSRSFSLDVALIRALGGGYREAREANN